MGKGMTGWSLAPTYEEERNEVYATAISVFGKIAYAIFRYDDISVTITKNILLMIFARRKYLEVSKFLDAYGKGLFRQRVYSVLNTLYQCDIVIRGAGHTFGIFETFYPKGCGNFGIGSLNDCMDSDIILKFDEEFKSFIENADKYEYAGGYNSPRASRKIAFRMKTNVYSEIV